MQKAIHKYRESSKSRPLASNNRPPAGIGWVIVPSDMDREEYIRRVYNTGYCMVISDFNDPIRDVAVPEHLIRSIKFPVVLGERGSLVSWISIPKSDQVILMGILQEPAESSPYEEGTLIDQVGNSDARVVRAMSTKDKSYTIAVTSDERGEGGVEMKTTGAGKTASITLNLDGTSHIKADDKLTIFAENELNIKISSKEGEVSTLTLTNDGVLKYLDRYKNDLTISEGGFHIANTEENLIKLINDLLKMYMQTKTIDGKVLDPASINEAVDLIRRFNTLIN